jgi:hypothetical protein
MAIWYILWSFGIFFPRLWYVVPRKIWQPCYQGKKRAGICSAVERSLKFATVTLWLSSKEAKNEKINESERTRVRTPPRATSLKTVTFVHVAGGVIPDAAAIHAARKQRQALRDGGAVTSSSSYIPINKKSSAQNSADDDSPDEDDDNARDRFCKTPISAEKNLRPFYPK